MAFKNFLTKIKVDLMQGKDSQVETLMKNLRQLEAGMEKDISKCLKTIAEDEKLLSRAARMPYFPFVIDKGKGSKVWDVDGNEYIDFLASAATVVLGHSPASVVEAVKAQLDKFLCYNIGYVYHEPVTSLSKKLVEITPGDFSKRTSYGLSGSDACDGAYHLARTYTKRSQFFSFRGAYHGVTVGAHNLCAIDPGMKKGSPPILPGIHHLPYPDCYRCPLGLEKKNCGFACVDSIEQVLKTEVSGDQVAGLIIEPVQGDSGMIVPPEGYLSKVANICKREGILFVAEEIQTGMGRTGEMFAVSEEKIEPDILVLGKGLGGGMAISALVSKAEIMESPDWSPPAHTFTHGGNPLSCVGALATIDGILQDDLPRRAAVLGKKLAAELNKMAEDFEIIGEIRGKGLMYGIDIVTDRKTKTRGLDYAKKICFRAWEKGMILTFLNGNVLRITPALNIPEELLWKGLGIIRECIKDVMDGKVSDLVLSIAKGR